MKSNLRISAIFLFLIQIVSKILGMLREMVLAYFFGSTIVTDIYSIVISLPDLIFSIFASGFTNSYITIHTRIANFKKQKEIFSNVFILLFLISLLFMISCIMFSSEIATLLAPGLDSSIKNTMNIYIKIIAISLPFKVVFALCSAWFQSFEKFILPEFLNFIVFNILIIFSMLFAKKWIIFLYVGYVIAQILTTLILFVEIYKKNVFCFKKISEENYRIFFTFLKLAIPLGLSAFANQINSTIDRMFASSLGQGVVSSISYANRIQQLFLTFTVTIFITVIFPRINKCYANNESKKAEQYVQLGIVLTTFISLPLIFILFMYSEEITGILFQRGAFNTTATRITGNCLKFYSVGILFYGMRDILSKVLLANKLNIIVLKNTIITVILNICFNLIFISRFGYIGLCLGTSISGFLSFLLMYISLKNYKINIFNVELIVKIFKLATYFIISVLLSSIILNFITINKAIKSIIYILLIIGFYFLFNYVFKIINFKRRSL